MAYFHNTAGSTFTGGLTDAQLRSSPVPVSGTVAISTTGFGASITNFPAGFGASVTNFPLGFGASVTNFPAGFGASVTNFPVAFQNASGTAQLGYLASGAQQIGSIANTSFSVDATLRGGSIANTAFSVDATLRGGSIANTAFSVDATLRGGSIANTAFQVASGSANMGTIGNTAFQVASGSATIGSIANTSFSVGATILGGSIANTAFSVSATLVGGAVASGPNVIGQFTGRGATTVPAAVADAAAVQYQLDKYGRSIVAWAPQDLYFQGSVSLAGTAATVVVASGAASIRHAIGTITAAVTASVGVNPRLDILDGTTIIASTNLLGNGTGAPFVLKFDPPWLGTATNPINAQLTLSATIRVAVTGFDTK